MSAVNVQQHYTDQFADEWLHKAQQLESRLKEYVTMESFTGKRKRFNLIDSGDDPDEVVSLAGPTLHSNISTEGRWIKTRIWSKAAVIDEWDDELLGEVQEIDSNLLNDLFMRFDRHCDKRIIAAALDDAYTGEDGDVAVPFDTNQSIAVDYVEQGTAATSNLTIGKLKLIRSKFGKNEVSHSGISGMSREPIVMAVTQAQKDSLLSSVKVQSADYNTVKALASGDVDEYMGIKFIQTETLPVDSNNVRTCVAWVKSGIKFSFGAPRVSIGERLDLSNATQIRVRLRNGGVRMEEKKVVRIYCDEDILIDPADAA